jgi:hypothetical protein
VNRVFADVTDFSWYPGDRSTALYKDVAGTDSIQAGAYVLHCFNLTPPPSAAEVLPLRLVHMNRSFILQRYAEKRSSDGE